jgi:hypothetical protein
LRSGSFLIDLPDSISLDNYREKLQQLSTDLKSLPTGQEHDQEYEKLVGEVIRLCFFRVLSNVESQVRNISGRVRRDWIASNRATTGFWEMIRLKHQATQIVWECKNYADLGPDDFHQADYYMNKQIGFFGIICFRGEIKEHYYEHIQRVSNQKEGGVLLLLRDRDLDVFIRQAINGKERDSHITEIYDTTIRKISQLYFVPVSLSPPQKNHTKQIFSQAINSILHSHL